MARFRPTAKFTNKRKQRRISFSGSHNPYGKVDARLLVLSKQMLTLLIANAATFPTPPSSIVDLGALIDTHEINVQVLGVKGTRGSMAATTNRNASRLALQNALASNSGYAQAISRALSPTSDIYIQVATLLSGGAPNRNKGRNNLPLVNNNAASKIRRTPAIPQGLRIIFPRPMVGGSTKISWQGSRIAKAYIVFDVDPIDPSIRTITATVPSASWVDNISPTGRKRIIAVKAVGPNGTYSGYSQPFTYHAL